MTREQREQERFALPIQAKITCRHHPTEQPVVATMAANISAGGAFLLTRHPFPLASKLQMEFCLQLAALKKLQFILSLDSLKKVRGDRLWVKTTGVVIRSEEEGVGVIFDTDYQVTPLSPADHGD